MVAPTSQPHEWRTGQDCPLAGVYRFDRYTDGTSSPSPTHEEAYIPMISPGRTFPPIKSANKGAVWRFERLIE